MVTWRDVTWREVAWRAITYASVCINVRFFGYILFQGVFILSWFSSGVANAQIQAQANELVVIETSPAGGAMVSDAKPVVTFRFSHPLDPNSVTQAEMLVIGTLSGLHTTQECELRDPTTLRCQFIRPVVSGETLQIQLRPTLRSMDDRQMAQPAVLAFIVSPLLTGAGELTGLATGWSPTDNLSSGGLSEFPDLPQLGIQGEEIELLANKAESFLFDRMGFQEFEYERVKRGSARATELRAGWQMNDRTQVWFVQEVRSAYPSNRFILEYDMNENLDILLTQGDQRWQGIDIRWKKEY